MQKAKDKSIRIKYGMATMLLMIVEVLIALFVRDDFIRPYVGDMLVVIVLYTFVRIFFPRKLKLLPLYIFIFAAMVEVSQYLGVIKWLGLDNIVFFKVLMGAVFDVKDIICYGVGCLLLVGYEWMRYKRERNEGEGGK